MECDLHTIYSSLNGQYKAEESNFVVESLYFFGPIGVCCKGVSSGALVSTVFTVVVVSAMLC